MKGYDLIYYFPLTFLMNTSKISWHVHLHHSDNTKLSVAHFCQLLDPISCQVLFNFPSKYLSDLLPQLLVWLLSLTIASQLVCLSLALIWYFLHRAVVISAKRCQTIVTAFDKTYYLPLSGVTHFFR